jgi:DNA-directed RNA polymerase III subunit RPC8
VFKPFVGEVMTGRVTHISKEGMKISVEFFDDISISGTQLQLPSDYNTVKNQWTWTYDDGENQAPFVTEVGDEIRFNVRSVGFTSVSQTAKGFTATTTSEISASETGNVPLVRRRSSSIGLGADESAPAAMQITGSTNDFGLGVTSWW